MKDKVVQAVVATYDKIDDCNCCSYGLFSNTLAITKVTKLYVCHAQLQIKYYSNNAASFDQLVTSWPYQSAEHLRFFDFMKWHLYRKWADFIHLEFTEEGAAYLLVSDLGQVPSNVVYNLCICSRMFVENPQFLMIWSDLCNQGLDPAFAFAVCKSDAKSNIDTPVLAISDGHAHHWATDNTLDLKRLMAGDPTSLNASFKDGGDCTPTTSIWGMTKDLRGLQGITIREFWNKWKETIE